MDIEPLAAALHSAANEQRKRANPNLPGRGYAEYEQLSDASKEVYRAMARMALEFLCPVPIVVTAVE